MIENNLTKIELQTNQETQKHIDDVRRLLKIVCNNLYERGINHDKSKLEKPEVEIFAKNTSKIAETTYDSEEYKQCLEEMKPALDCHYAKNDHHPEFYPNGINDINIFVLIEMVCDWISSASRQQDGNILKSIEKAIERFKIDNQLSQIIKNTINKLVG